MKTYSLNTQKKIFKNLNGKIPIIGVGGIMNAKDGLERFANGAELIQIYTGFIYQGNQLINELLKSITQK